MVERTALEVGRSELSYQSHRAAVLALFLTCKWTDGGVIWLALCPHMALLFVHTLQASYSLKTAGIFGLKTFSHYLALL